MIHLQVEIKLPTIFGSWRKQESFRKTSVSLTTQKPLTMWIPTNWKVFRDRSTRSPYLSPEKHACRSRRTEQGIEQLTGSKLKHLPAMQETWVQSLGWKDPLEKKKYPRQYSGLENSMDGIVHGVTKSRTRRSDLPFIFFSLLVLYLLRV